MTTPLKVGVIGLGQRIAHVLMAMDDIDWSFDVIGHVDPDPIGRPLLAGRGLGEGRSFPDTQALLAEGPFDLLMIGSPNHLHYDHLIAALGADCPIFTEKPIVADPGGKFRAPRAAFRDLACRRSSWVSSCGRCPSFAT